jgi:hypothetical protein
MVIRHGKYAIVIKPVAVVAVASLLGVVAWRVLSTGGNAFRESAQAESRVLNPVQNADFEDDYNPALTDNEEKLGQKKAVVTGSIAHPWKDRSRWSEVEVHYEPEERKQYRGKRAQKIEVTQVRSGTVKFCQGVRTTPGKRYRLEMMVRADALMKITVGIRQVRAEKYDAVRTVSVPQNWQKVEVEGVATGNASYIMLETSDRGTLMLDATAFSEQ